MAQPADPFAEPVAVARRWLDRVGTELDDDERDLAYRAMRVWFHLVRDRLPVVDSAHFAARLPVLLRGIYYEGWQPSRVPIKYTHSELVSRFAREAGITPAEVPYVARAVSQAMAVEMGGNLESVLHHFPRRLAVLLAPQQPTVLRELLDY
jgi:uncharacterized protein (DUF2267 family)